MSYRNTRTSRGPVTGRGGRKAGRPVFPEGYDPGPVQRVEDPLGRVWTPSWVSEAACEVARELNPNPKVVIDPGVGQEARLLMAAAMYFPGARRVAVDIDPQARFRAGHEAVLGDWLRIPVPTHWMVESTVLTNPPYHEDGRHWAHIERAMSVASTVVAILPADAITLASSKVALSWPGMPCRIFQTLLTRPWVRLRGSVILGFAEGPGPSVLRPLSAPPGTEKEP